MKYGTKKANKCPKSSQIIIGGGGFKSSTN